MNIAIVTGASSGLGREFVRQMDKYNLKNEGCMYDEIWVIARREDRLIGMQSEIKTPIRAVPIDLSSVMSIEKFKTMLEQEKPCIRMLVCSAGFGRVGSYEDISMEDCNNMINLNCRAAVDITQVSIPYMKKGSRIAEVCSMVGFLPLSYMNIYAATKAFMVRYSRALNVELKSKGISVTAVCPYWVKDTEFIERSKESKNSEYVTFYKFAGSTSKTVKKAFKDVIKRKPVSTPSPVSKVMRGLSGILPDTVLLWGWEKIRN